MGPHGSHGSHWSPWVQWASWAPWAPWAPRAHGPNGLPLEETWLNNLWSQAPPGPKKLKFFRFAIPPRPSKWLVMRLMFVGVPLGSVLVVVVLWRPSREILTWWDWGIPFCLVPCWKQGYFDSHGGHRPRLVWEFHAPWNLYARLVHWLCWMCAVS